MIDTSKKQGIRITATKKKLVWFLSICLLLTAGIQQVISAEPAEKLKRFEYQQAQMGVPFRLTFYATDEQQAKTAAVAAFHRVQQINSSMSDYDPESELMRLCRTAAVNQPVAVSDDLFRVLRASQDLAKASHGAFDITVGPMVKLWRQAKRRKALPTTERMAAIRQRVGWRQVRLNEKSKSVQLQRAGILLDLGGIAKGFAADEMLKTLKQRGIQKVLIDAGGDIVVGDAPPGKTGWKIGIAALKKPDGPPAQFLSLKNCAIATSGDAYQYLEIDGKRYSHIVNPKTGLGLITRNSVSVIAPIGMQADSLASAVSVLGPEEGIKLVSKQKKAYALIVVQDQGIIKTYHSCDFPKLKVDGSIN